MNPLEIAGAIFIFCFVFCLVIALWDWFIQTGFGKKVLLFFKRRKWKKCKCGHFAWEHYGWSPKMACWWEKGKKGCGCKKYEEA